MSRKIDWDVPLSDEDRAYLKQRGQFKLISHLDEVHGSQEDVSEQSEEQDEEQDGGNENSAENVVAIQEGDNSDYDPDDVAFVQSLKVEELRVELGNRTLDTGGLKPDLQKRLLDALKNEPAD